MLIKILILIVFFAIMIAVGVYARRQASTVSGFVLGGRSVGPWLSAFAYGTSYFSAVIFIGYAGQFGWRFGLASTWIGIGNAVLGSLLAWVVLGRRTRVMTRHLQSATMPSFFEARYESTELKIVASVIIFVFLVPYTASVFNGLSKLFGMAFDIPYSWCVLAMAALTGVYVILGGYMATALNDFIQGLIMLFGIIAVIAAVLNGHGGFMQAVRTLSEIPSEDPVTLGQQGAYTSFFGPNPVGLLSVVILTSLGTWGLPQMVQKFYAIKNEKSITTGTIVSTFFAIIIAGGSYFLGGFGRLVDVSEVSDTVNGVVSMHYDAIMPALLENLPDVLMGILVVLVMSASMSTLSSLVLASSSTITLDLIFQKPANVKRINPSDRADDIDREKKILICLRVFIVFFLVLSVVLALDPPTFIAQLMGISWGALAGAFLAPFLYGLYWKKVTPASVWASFIFGVGFTVLNLFFNFTNTITAGAIAMVGGLVIVPLVSLITPKLPEKDVDEMFSCYDEEVDAKTKNILPEEEDF